MCPCGRGGLYDPVVEGLRLVYKDADEPLVSYTLLIICATTFISDTGVSFGQHFFHAYMGVSV